MTRVSVQRQHALGGSAVSVAVFGLTALAVGVLLATRGVSAETLGLTLRGTARLSFSLFVVVFSAGALARLGLGSWPLVNRRHLGLAFGGVHLIHGGLVLTLAASVHDGDLTRLSPGWQLVGGALVYGLILALMLTSTDRAVERLGVDRWRRRHRFGGWPISLVFLGACEVSPSEAGLAYAIPLMVLAVALALRFVSRATTPAAGPGERPEEA